MYENAHLKRSCGGCHKLGIHEEQHCDVQKGEPVGVFPNSSHIIPQKVDFVNIQL
jgi:hypothetical protein